MNDEVQAGNTRKRWRSLLIWIVAAVFVGTLFLNKGSVFKSISSTWGPEPVTDVQRFPFQVLKSGVVLQYRIRVNLHEGRARIKIVGPNDKTIVEGIEGSIFTDTGPLHDEECTPGEYFIEVQSVQAVGECQVAVLDKKHAPTLNTASLATGKLMAAVGALAIWGWIRLFGIRWRFFLIGGAIWVLGVALKFGWALPLNQPIFKALGEFLTGHLSFVASVIYIGLLTGVFEIGVTIMAAWRWPGLSQNAAQAMAIGIGAGATEALGLGALLALSTVGNLDAAVFGPQSLSLVPVAERALALLCHTASRALVFFAAATGRWRWAWVGFGLLTAVDAVAGVFLLYKGQAALSPSFLQLAIVPFAIVSILVLILLFKRWPKQRSSLSERQLAEAEQMPD